VEFLWEMQDFCGHNGLQVRNGVPGLCNAMQQNVADNATAPMQEKNH
jgi:hypothetical protein